MKMKKIIKRLKEDRKEAQRESTNLDKSTASQDLPSVPKADMPPVYLKTIARENEDLQAENRELKEHVTFLNQKLKDKEDTITKLQAIIKRFKKMVKGMGVNNILHRNVTRNRSMAGISDTVSDNEISSPAKFEHIGKTKEKLTAFLLLMDAAKKLNLARAISLYIK